MKKISCLVLVLSIMFGLCSCEEKIDIGDIVDAVTPKFEDTKTETLTFSDAGSISAASFENRVGGFNISYHDADFAQYDITYIAKADTMEDISEIFDRVKCELETENEVLTFKTIYAERDANSFEEFLNEFSKSRSCSVEVDVLLPKNFCDIKAETDVGNVVCKGINGCFDVKVDVGNISVVESSFSKSPSNLKVDVGNITADILEVNEEVSVDLTADVGNIIVETGDLPCEKTDLADENNFVGDECQINVATVLTLNAKANVGEITVN